MMCCSNSSKALSRLGLIWGLLSLATLLTAFISNVWLFTREPIRLRDSDVSATVTFKIGLWRVCPSFKKENFTRRVPNPPCSLIKYSPWDEITYQDIGMWNPLEFTPAFLSRMRFSTPFEAVSVVLISLATLFALMGHCTSDHKTLIACGLYMLGGLVLGGGLFVFASVLSDAYFERPRHQHVFNEILEKLTTSSSFEYNYGWSFFAAGAAFVMAEIAAVLSITAYLRRFPTVEDMVRVMVPGAERRLREHQGLSGEYLVQHHHKYQRHKHDGSVSLSSGLNTRCYSKSDVIIASDLEGVEGPLLLSKTAPDICTSNPAILTEDVIDFTGPASGSSNIGTAAFSLKSDPPTFILDEKNNISSANIKIKPTAVSLAGQTVPIVLMHNQQRNTTLPNTTQITPFLFAEQLHDKRCNTATLPVKEKQQKGDALDSKYNTMLPRRVSSNQHVATLDSNLFKDKLNEFKDFETHMTLNERFGSGLSHLSTGLDLGGKTYNSPVLGVPNEVPGTSSTASSSSVGTNNTTTGSIQSSLSSRSYQPQKKKSVTIGSVFSTMDTYDSKKLDDDLFGGASVV